MPGEDESAGVGDALARRYRVERLERDDGGVRVYRAREVHVERIVTLRLAEAEAGSLLLADARRIAQVHHPGLVAVLAVGTEGASEYVATADLAARPLSETSGLSDDEAARVAFDVAGAIDALAHAGLCAPVSAETVLVASTPSGVRGILDPLRASGSGNSVVSAGDGASSASELADVIEGVIAAPGEALQHTLSEVRSGRGSEAGLRALSAAPVATRRRGRLIVASIAVLAAALAVVFAIRASQDGDGASGTTRLAPAGRVVASVPLGLPANEVPVGVGVGDPTVWIATSAGRLVRIDTAKGAVVGAPVKLPGKHPLAGMVTDGGSLLMIDYTGWILRVDSRTARVTARRHVAAELDAMTLVGDALWVAARTGLTGDVRRFDARTLKPLGAPLAGVSFPRQIVAHGSRAWVLGGDAWGEVVRVDARDGSRAHAWVGPAVVREALSGDTIWLTDEFNGTVSPLDATRMVFTDEALHPARSTMGSLSVAGDVWVKVTDALGDRGPEFLERFDGRTGRRLGARVAVGHNGRALAYSRGSLWVATATTLLRLRPAPRVQPSVQPTPAPVAHARALVAGPLPEGQWRGSLQRAHFTFSTTAFDWLAVYPLTGIMEIRGARGLEVSVRFATPSQVFRNDSALVAVRSARQMLAVLHHNALLRVVDRGTIVVGGRRALRIRISARNPHPHPEVCGPHRCTLLYPGQNFTEAVAEGGWREMLLLENHGTVVVIGEEGAEQRDAQAAASRLLKTVRFS